jgi:hypothetical protein
MSSLPINLQKDVTSYLNYSLPLCSILSNKKNKNWLSSRFLNIYSIESSEKLWLDFLEPVDFYTDVASQQFTPSHQLPDDFNLIEHVKSCLSKGYYLSFFVDSSDLLPFTDQSHPLQLWAYAYDEENQIISSPGFSGERDFELVNYPVEKIERAFQTLFKARQDQPIWYQMYCLTEVSILTYQGGDESLSDTIRNSILNYAQSTALPSIIRPEFDDTPGQRRFGFDAICALSNSLDPNASECRFIYQMAHLLFEHKKQIHQALLFLYASDTGNQLALKKAVTGYQGLVSEFEKFRRTLMMGRLKETYWETFYGSLSDSKTIIKLKSKLDVLIATEQELLNQLVKQL